ncbi:MAG: OmpA family protein [Psychroflexus halocasei]
MKTLYIFLLSFVVCTTALHAQNKNTKKGDKHFDRLEFVDAIKDYEKLIKKGKADAYVYKQLAISNYKIYKTKKAETYYKRYLRMDKNASAKDHLAYAQTLLANEKLDEFKSAMQKFADMKPQDDRAKAFKENPDYVSKLLFMEPKFEVGKSDLSSNVSDFGAYEHDGKLYFVSARNKSRRTYGWNDQPTLDVFVAQNVGGTFKDEAGVEGDVNSKFHEGTIAITSDGKTIYFTRNDYVDGDYEKDEEGINQLKLFMATKRNNEWVDVKPLPFNSSEYSTGHPALSPDNKTLYFSSDRPGGQGQSDLYKVEVKGKGKFGEPKNLGDKINTPGRESFPFVDADDKLYFSSDGHLGIGGLDVFYTTIKNGQMDEPRNIGKPINSSADDFAFTFKSSMKSGYFASNRGNDPLNDNIYFAELIEPLDQTEVIVTVLNEDTNEPVVKAEVIIYDEDESEIDALKTDLAGEANTIVLSSMDYDIQVNKEDFESSSKRISAEGEQMMVEVMLTPVEEIIKERSISLENTFFEFDSAKIRPEAALELDNVAEVMKKYDDIRIKITSHTDRRGPAEYNKTLSEARAKSTIDYLVSKGIDASRLEGEGRGEEDLLVDCGSNCTEDDHRKNRRSEFKIIE